MPSNISLVRSGWKASGNCQCNRVGAHNCKEDTLLKRADFFERDIDDIADSVMQVMRICGLPAWVVKRTKKVIKQSFRHYDEIRYRIDRVPRKRFAKESFMHGLAFEAQMSRMDSQLAYSIVKRAFKAYYHGTGIEGKRHKSLTDSLRHRQECLWLHAAKRTAKIFAAYAGLLYSEEQQYEERIECVYKNLFEVLQPRIIYEEDMQCRCGGVNSPSIWGGSRRSHDTTLTNATSVTAEVEVLFKKQTMAASGPTSLMSIRMEQVLVRQPPKSDSPEVSNPPSSVPSRHQQKKMKKPTGSVKSSTTKLSSAATSKSKILTHKCKCPHLQCDRVFGREAPEITAECSQGPYICRWLPYDEKEEQFKEHCVPYPPLEVICPPCVKESELPCDPDCTCTCKICTCEPAFYEGGEEENQGEKPSGSGVEDYDTDYCWLAPFRDGPRLDKPQKAKQTEEATAEEEHVEGEQDELFKCKCTCDYKQRAFPHLFTYLAPFKTVKLEEQQEPAKELDPAPVEDKPEDLLTKPPPFGISRATFLCWNQPTPSSTESSVRDEPQIHVLQQPQVPGFALDVTVKTQHSEPGGKHIHIERQAVPPAERKRSTIKRPSAPRAMPQPRASTKTATAPARKSEVATSPPPQPKAVTQTPPPPDIGAQSPRQELTKEDILDIIGLRHE